MFGKAVKRNKELTITAVILELRTAQQLNWQQLYTTFLRQTKKLTRNGTRLVSYRSLDIIIYETSQPLINRYVNH
jgi:hypothetical protein